MKAVVVMDGQGVPIASLHLRETPRGPRYWAAWTAAQGPRRFRTRDEGMLWLEGIVSGLKQPETFQKHLVTH